MLILSEPQPQRPARSPLYPALLGLVVALLAQPIVAQAREDERLSRAAKKLRADSEEEVRAGAQLCAEIDSLESIELLLRILDGSQPHYRDIVSEALPAFRDPQARERVAQELARNRKNEGVRQWCARLLGSYGDEEHAEILVKALADDVPEVRAAAAQALGRIREPSAAKTLSRLALDEDAYVRAYALEALARIAPEVHGDLLRKALEDPDAGVRCFLLGCVPEVLPGELDALSTRALEDSDWRVRQQAIENLDGSPTREALVALIAASGDARPVLANSVQAVLQRRTGMRWTKKEQWEQWWREKGAELDPTQTPPPEQAAASEEQTIAVRYNDLPIESDHVAFLIDVSAQMSERLASQKRSKATAALAELERVFGLLEGRLVFNVYVYDSQARAFEEQPVPLTARTRKKALAFVDGAHAKGNKDIWAALCTVLEDTELDTLYLLASGEPEVGLYVHYNRVVEHLRELQRFHKIVVHGVCYSSSEWYRRQIEEICKATGGRFRAFE